MRLRPRVRESPLTIHRTQIKTTSHHRQAGFRKDDDGYFDQPTSAKRPPPYRSASRSVSTGSMESTRRDASFMDLAAYHCVALQRVPHCSLHIPVRL